MFHQDGTVQLDIKLTGILNTYSLNPGEDTHGWGTEVYPGVNAHNHQHLFCMRIDANIDGPENTVFQVDAVRSAAETGSAENKYGNAFYAKKTKYTTPREAMADYDGSTSRTWEMANTNKLNDYSKKPVCYKLVNREVPPFLPKPGGLAWKRAGFARHAVHVTNCKPVYPNFRVKIIIIAVCTDNYSLRRSNPPGRSTRPPNLRRAVAGPPGLDRSSQPQQLHWKLRRRTLAYLRVDAFPNAGGLPDHAGGANDGSSETAQLLQTEPGAGCAS